MSIGFAGIGEVRCTNDEECKVYCGNCVKVPEDHERCKARSSEYYRCDLYRGHLGSHVNGGASWDFGPGKLGDVPVCEKIDHPAHYGGDNPCEHQKVVRAWGLNYHLGNCTKYICRAGKKNSETLLEDLKKAKWYLDNEIAYVESEQNKK